MTKKNTTDPGGSASLYQVIGSVVSGLRAEPPLLFAFGGAILILGLAGFAAGQVWLLVAAIVVIVLAGLITSVVAGRGRDAGPHSGVHVTADRDIRASGQAGIGLGEKPEVNAGRDIVASGRSRVGAEESSPVSGSVQGSPDESVSRAPHARP